ncbi:SH2 domain protein [Oesophagostomum dentatum]|uniref:Tyrosine-protein kinase n=1 Tax=Oesophagostomum dentatum TaxID=61180 RepID=A0A0B1TA47_OESDE|nr:SH2 domain protein [Oesophagostomum dentatum]
MASQTTKTSKEEAKKTEKTDKKSKEDEKKPDKSQKTENDDKAKNDKTEAKGDLEHQIWYHGFRPRKDVIALLKQPGDFLVRATDSRNMPEIVISVMNDRMDLVNLTIKCDNKKLWQLGVLRKSTKAVPKFPQVAELINYYRDHKLPGHARLKRGIPRPVWLIKHELVTFDTKKDLLGRGNYCNVYKGIYTRHDEKIVVAVKVCHEGSSFSKGFQETKEARNSMLSEAQMMSYYVHNHVIEMFGVACDHPPIEIVMEYCPGGDLQSHLLRQKEAIEAGERLIYTLEAARGMRWMAPESLRRPLKFSTKSDVWSFGVMMYEIFNCGVKPWPEEPPKKIATLIRKLHLPKMPDRTPEDVKTLVSQIWVGDPAQRPTMKQICSTLFSVTRKYPPPPADKFTLNNIKGVQRLSPELAITMEETVEVEDEADVHIFKTTDKSTDRATEPDKTHTDSHKAQEAA